MEDKHTVSTSAMHSEVAPQGGEQSEPAAVQDKEDEHCRENNGTNLSDGDKNEENDNEQDDKKDDEEGDERENGKEKKEDDKTDDQDDDDDESSFNPDSDGTSISGRSTIVLAREHQKPGTIRKRYMQHAQHLRITEDRLRVLEKKLRVYRESSEASSRRSSLADPVKAFSELRFLPWTEFKTTGSKHNIHQPHYAIDVLLGEPLLFHQQHKNFHHPDADSLGPEEADNLPLNSIPDRIRINSVPLHEVLKNVLRGTFHQAPRPLVILRPYKPLLYAEEELRETLSGLEKRWAVRSDTQAADSEDDVGNNGERNDGDRNDAYHDDGEHEKKEDASDSANVSRRGSSDVSQNGLLEPLPRAQSAEAMSELRCLLRFVDAIKPMIVDIQRIPSPLPASTDSAKSSRATIPFKDLWFIFQPGQYLFNRQGPHKLWRVLQVTGGRNYLSTRDRTDQIEDPQMTKISPVEIDCYYLDYNGKTFGPVHHRFKILPFEGPKHITDLEVHPIKHLPNHKELIDTLTERGAQFIRATQVTHKYFKGRTLVLDPKGERIAAPSSDKSTRGTIYSEDVESPVMVDFDRTLQFNPKWTPEFGYPELAEQDERETREMSLKTELKESRFNPRAYDRRSESRDLCFTPGCCDNEHILNDFLWDKKNFDDFLSAQGHLYKLDEQVKVPEDEYVLFPNRVLAYILRSRKWGMYYVFYFRILMWMRDLTLSYSMHTPGLSERCSEGGGELQRPRADR